MVFEKRNDYKLNKEKISEISRKHDLSEMVVRLMFYRGIDTEEKINSFMSNSEEKLNDPYLLKNMKETVSKIKDHIKNGSKFLIFGDYDVDGMSSTAILYLYLKNKGVEVSTYLPNRYVDGYGLTVETLDKIIIENKPDIILTVDCGITSLDEVEYIKKKNIDIIITDHHEPQDSLPNCLIINPKIKGQDYPFNDLCGAGVAFKVVQAVEGIDEALKYIDICAIATIADIVSLTDENRLIVKLGINKMVKKPRPGISILLKKLKLYKTFNSTDIAFKVAPKINAAGRMGKAEVGLNLLIETNTTKLNKLADELIELNKRRQELCSLVYNESIELIKKNGYDKDKIIVLHSKAWDEGLLGIIAGRIVEKYNRPCILFSDKGNMFKGSARSIDGVDIHKLLSNINIEMESFGGHIMAAGLTVSKTNLESFINEIKKTIDIHYPEFDFTVKKYYDFDIDIKDINLKFIRDFAKLEPFGHNNNMPTFRMVLNGLKVLQMKKIPEHLILNTNNNITFLHFDGKDYINNYNYFNKKDVLVNFQISKYKNKDSINGIIKQVKFNNPNYNRLKKFTSGNYIKQLTYKSTQAPKFSYYEADTFKQVNEIITRNSDTSVLVVAYTLSNYEKLLSNISFNDNNIFNVSSNLSEKSIVLAPSIIDGFESFTHIVFAENVLNLSYVSEINKVNSDAKIYIPKIKEPINLNLSTSREAFGNYFNLIKSVIKKNNFYSNLYEMFDYTNKINKGEPIQYAQFYFCLIVLIELSIIKFRQNDNNIKFSYNKNIASDLKKSNMYRNVININK